MGIKNIYFIHGEASKSSKNIVQYKFFRNITGKISK